MPIPIPYAHAYVQKLVKMATVFEYTTEERRSIVRFLCAKGPKAKDIYKEVFLVYCGKCLSRSQLCGEILSRKVADDARVGAVVAETIVRHFCAAGFDALAKRCDKGISVGGGYVEK
jgi:hypothetical protein